MSYETIYWAQKRQLEAAARNTPEARERTRLECRAAELAERDVKARYPGFPACVTPMNASAIADYQQERIRARRKELGVVTP